MNLPNEIKQTFRNSYYDVNMKREAINCRLKRSERKEFGRVVGFSNPRILRNDRLDPRLDFT